MKELSIYFAGPGLSGRHESLIHISRLSVQGFDFNSNTPYGPFQGIWKEDQNLYPYRLLIHAYSNILWSVRGHIYDLERGHSSAMDSAANVEADFLRNTDGIIFVIDSQEERTDANLELLQTLAEDLKFLVRNPDNIPLVFQVNKRDLFNILTMMEVKKRFIWNRCRYIETVAPKGIGVGEAFSELIAVISFGNHE